MNKDISHIDIERTKELLSRLSCECFYNARRAVTGALNYPNTINISLQFMNQAFQCMKLAQYYYLQYCERGEILYFEDFLNQFDTLNTEFLTALQTDHSLQWSHTELERLAERFNELKLYFE